MKRVLLIASSCLIFCTTYAGPINSSTIFYCQTTKGKQIKVEKHKSYIIYSYGKNLKKPELTLKRKLSEVDIYRGSYRDGKILQITLFNKKYAYTIYSGFTREGKFNYLSVSKNGNEIVELECVKNTVMTKL